MPDAPIQDAAAALPVRHVSPAVPTPSSVAQPSIEDSHTTSHSITPEQIAQANKFCKYASSALTYDDVPTAVENLQKALRLLQTGHV